MGFEHDAIPYVALTDPRGRESSSSQQRQSLIKTSIIHTGLDLAVNSP